MRYLPIIFVCFGLIVLISCKEVIGERHTTPSKQNRQTPSVPEKVDPPRIEDSIKTPTRIQRDRKIKKKKKQVSDTLRPKVATLYH